MADAIRVLVVEDHTLVREGLVAMLGATDGIDVVGEAGDGERALELASSDPCDVVLLDLRLPKVDGLEVLRRLKGEDRDRRVIALTVHDEQAYVGEALLAGADGYLLKTVAHDELTDAIRRVAQGEVVLHPAVSRTALTELTQLASRDPSSELSVRELDVLRHLAEGLSNKQIALRLDVGVETVKSHISSILHKLEVSDRTEAVAVALRRRLIE